MFGDVWVELLLVHITPLVVGTVDDGEGVDALTAAWREEGGPALQVADVLALHGDQVGVRLPPRDDWLAAWCERVSRPLTGPVRGAVGWTGAGVAVATSPSTVIESAGESLVQVPYRAGRYAWWRNLPGFAYAGGLVA